MNTVVLVTRSRDESDGESTAARLSRTRRVCARTSFPPTSSPLAGSSASCPAQKMRSPATMAWLYGPTGAGARSLLVTRRSISSPFRERADDGTHEALIILRQNASQVERHALQRDPCDDRRVRGAKRLRQAHRRSPTQRYGERVLGLFRQRTAADGGTRLRHQSADTARAERACHLLRATAYLARARGDHPPDRKLFRGATVPIGLERGDKAGDGDLVGAQRTHQWMYPKGVDARLAPDRHPGLRTAQQLVAAERHHVGALADGLGHGELSSEPVARRVQKRPAAEIVDERKVVLPRERRDVATFGARPKTADLEVAGVDTKDRSGLLRDRSRVVAHRGPVRRPDLDELRAGTPQDIRDTEAAADLDELPARDDHLLPRGEGGEREQDGSRVVVHDHRVLGTREIRENPSGVAVTLATLAGSEVVFDADRP